ncbi:MAG: C39 family peptidase [Clostridia bacterium]|nr:C39 family peptidase [Clostridia bacterium]
MKRFFILILAILTLSGCVSYPELDPVMGSFPTGVSAPTFITTEATEPTSEPLPPPTSTYKGSGKFESDTGTTLVLRMEWEAAQNETEHAVDMTVRLYLQYEGELTLTPSENNTLTVGEEQITFKTEKTYPESEEPVLLCEHATSIPREDGADMTVRLVGKVYSGCTYEEYEFKSLTAQGNLIISDKYADLPRSADLDVDVIKQNPELPNGCEVTSLCMALNYHGYKISKMKLKEGYLPIGTENIYEYNIGDPAERKGSYGCYSPVIKRTADAYYADKGIERTATDLTHCNIEELYYQVSQGDPVIVWATQYMDVRPYNIVSWEIDGLTFNWKAPLHCMLLTGYDMEEGTVTLTDPIYGVITHEMELFETRWHQMGEQAVIA